MSLRILLCDLLGVPEDDDAIYAEVTRLHRRVANADATSKRWAEKNREKQRAAVRKYAAKKKAEREGS